MPKPRARTTAKTKAIEKPRRDPEESDREAVLDERETLRRQFPPAYAADIGVLPGDKVEVILTLTYTEAQSLARLLKKNKL